MAGDVIVMIGDTDTPDLNALVATLAARKPDENVPIHVLRGGEELVVPATLGRR